MKQKKRSGLSRIGALLLVFILAVNLVVPCFAAGGVVFDDTKTIDTGILTYDYDKIPKYMLEDNYALDALEYIGYDVQALKDNKVLYHQDYIGRHLASSQYLLQDDPILTYIKYSDSGAPGGSEKKAETAEELAATKTGRVPDIDRFKNGNDTWKPGMSCTSFVEYFVFGYLKHIVGKDTKYIENMHATALARLANGTRTYPDTWTEMCEGKGGLISQGKVKHYSVELDDSKEQTDKYNAIWRDIGPGTIIRFGNDNSDYLHYAVYIGTYNNLHYVAHVAGGDRGPEIFIAEHMSLRNDEKTSFPIDFYDFKFQDPYGAIQVVKADADDDTKLPGAEFVAINIETGLDYTIGPTNEKGYAIFEELPYGTYTVRETVAPQGYALSDKTWTVVLKSGNSLETLYHEIVNEKSYGSLQIQKDTNTGNNKAGWQFNLYKNSPTYTTQLTTDNSGQMFRVTVSDYKGNSVTSDAVSMTTTPLKILKQPQSVKVSLGDTARFHVTVQGDGLEYKWYYQNPGEPVSEAGSTAGMYTPYYNYSITSTKRSGRAMWCVITDKYGNSVTTDKAYLWLNTDPNAPSTIEAATSLITYGNTTTVTNNVAPIAGDALVITKQPQSHVDEDGTFARFEVEAKGVGLTYVWETSTDGGKTWTRLTNPINDEPYETDSTGKYLISKLQTGNYFVQEIDTGKDGWEYDLVAKPVTVTADHTATAPAQVNFTNNELLGSVFIDKYTEDDQNYEGWEFAIYSDAGCTNLIAGPETTDMDGFHLFDGLAPGTYWVKELGHIDPAIDELYYCASENPQMVTVEAGETATVQFENKLNRGSIEIIKKGDNSELLSDAAFQATNSAGKVFTFTESTDKPGYYFLSDVPYDTYTIVETQTPDGYKAGPETKWEVTLDKNSPNAQESITIVNIEILGGVSIKKTTEDNKNLKDWIFNIYADEECSTLISGPHYTDDGGLIHVDNLKPGTYWIKEEGNLNANIADLYYCNSNNPQSVEVVDGSSDTVTFENKLKYGKLEIHKETNTGDRKEGWKFHVYFVNEDGSKTEIPNSPFTAPADGILLIEKLLPGKYIVTEEQSGFAYWSCDVTTLETTVQAGQTTDPLVFTNTVKGLLQVKKETTDGSSVAGYKFNIYGPDGNLIPGSPFTTNGKGYITGIDYVLPGMYTVEEVLPADSAYEVVGSNRQTLEIKPEEVTTFTFVNAPKVGTLEIQKETNTGKDKGGWKVNVYRGSVAEENLLPGSPFTTDDQYGKIVITDLPIGIYIAVEVDDGKEMWVYDLNEKTAEVPHNGTGHITITNTHKGYGQIFKETTNGGTKEGWIFQIKDAAGNVMDGEYKSNGDGYIDLGLLAPGTYTVTEIGHRDMTPEQLAYWIMNAETKTLTIEAGETRSVTFDNQWIGKGQIIKTTVNGGSAAGWQFKVWQEGTEPITVTTKEGGVFDLGLLEPGTYYVQEVGHETYDLSYWIMDTEVKTLTVVAGETSSVTFENVWMGELVIDKQAINSDLLAGWTGDLYLVNADGSETKIGTYTSNESGRFTELLVAPGKYIFRETGHSDSSVDLTYWVMAGDKEIEVTTGTTIPATIINTKLGLGQIRKDTPYGGTKEGWIFEIKDAAGNVMDGSFISDAHGDIGLGLLTPGTYTVTEIGHRDMTPEQLAYWKMDTEEKTLEVKAGETKSVTFENSWFGTILVEKKMPDGGPVAGWVFDVYRISDNAHIGTFTTDTEGLIHPGLLVPGDYRIVEQVPENSLYRPVGGNEWVVTVEGGEATPLEVINTLRSGEIILDKLDTSNDKALAGAKFLLEWLNNDVWTPVVFSDTIQPGGCRSDGLDNGCLVTGEDGRIVFTGLHPDYQYRLTEVEAPNGYTLQSAPVFEGKLPDDTLSKEVTAYNSGVIISPPTGVDDHLNELVVFTAIVVCLFITMVALAAKEGLLAEMIRGNKK